jgi:hypothetical protein
MPPALQCLRAGRRYESPRPVPYGRGLSGEEEIYCGRRCRAGVRRRQLRELSAARCDALGIRRGRVLPGCWERGREAGLADRMNAFLEGEAGVHGPLVDPSEAPKGQGLS